MASLWIVKQRRVYQRSVSKAGLNHAIHRVSWVNVDREKINTLRDSARDRKPCASVLSLREDESLVRLLHSTIDVLVVQIATDILTMSIKYLAFLIMILIGRKDTKRISVHRASSQVCST